MVRRLIRGKNDSNFEPSQNQMHMLVRVIVSFDDFLSRLTIPPVWLNYSILITIFLQNVRRTVKLAREVVCPRNGGPGVRETLTPLLSA